MGIRRRRCTARMYRLRIAPTRKRRCYAPSQRGNRHHITRVDFHRRTLHDDRYGEYEPEHPLLPDQDAFRSFQRSANDAHTSSGAKKWMRFNTVAVFQASSNGGEVRFRYEGRVSTKAHEPDNSGDLNGPGAIAKRDLYENVAAKKRSRDCTTRFNSLSAPTPPPSRQWGRKHYQNFRHHRDRSPADARAPLPVAAVFRAKPLCAIQRATILKTRELEDLANSVNYDRTTIFLHWITAGLVGILWMIGQTADWFPEGALNTDYWSIHVVLGFALAVMIVWRIIWRTSGGRRLPAADAGVLHIAAKATHYGSIFVAGRCRAGDHERLGMGIQSV